MCRNLPVKIEKQDGIVVLLLVVVVAIASITYFITNISLKDIKYHQQTSTSKALQQAKRALIAYAATYGDIDFDGNLVPDFPGQYGYLPCPDYNAGLAEGLEDNGNCGNQYRSKLGYFPWRTLGLPVLKDDSGNCLMYAVTGEYKNDESTPPSFKSLMLNEDSNGMFQIIDRTGTVIRGQTPEDRVVAIVFAPGTPMPGQNRSINQAGSACGMEYGNVGAYLDAYIDASAGVNVNNSYVVNLEFQVDQFLHTTADLASTNNPSPFNDRFITISRDEIWQAIVSRADFIQKMSNLTEALAMCLVEYASDNGLNRLPWPVQADLSNYQQNARYNDNADEGPGYAGRFPFIVDDSNSDIGVVGSPELFTVAGCNALATTGDVVDLQTPGSEYRELWENWKDHFFYAVSRDYSPANVPASCGTSCISVGSIDRAGMVIFAASRKPGQIRNSPLAGDVDSKFNVAMYLENGNDSEFPDYGGNGSYNTPNPTVTNDIIFCITADATPDAISC